MKAFALTWMQYARGCDPIPCRTSYHATLDDAGVFVASTYVDRQSTPLPDLHPQEDPVTRGHKSPEEVKVDKKNRRANQNKLARHMDAV
jgi:hypothetical protein